MMPSLSGKYSFRGNCCTVTGVNAVRMMEPILSATSNEIAGEGGWKDLANRYAKLFLKVAALLHTSSSAHVALAYSCSFVPRKREREK